MAELIRTRELTRVFRAGEVETTALRQVSLDIGVGEFVAIMGPSGCGKTTLLNLLGLLDQPSGGQYFFLGKDVTRYSERQKARIRKSHIGFVFQNFNLIDELTVFENVELPLVYLKLPAGERRRMVETSLDRMRISHRRDFFPGQLSGGQQQRVAVARAVVANPRIILADEPTGNLDSANGEEVMHLLSDLNKEGTSIIIVTHSERDADFSQRIIRLFDGKIIHENLLRHRKTEE